MEKLLVPLATSISVHVDNRAKHSNRFHNPFTITFSRVPRGNISELPNENWNVALKHLVTHWPISLELVGGHLLVFRIGPAN